MSARFSIRSELAATIRRVNVAYRALPEEVRPDVRWDAVDDALEAALKSGSHRQALAGIRAWEVHWRATFREVAR